MAGVEQTLISWALQEVVGPAAFPTLGCVLLWLKLQKQDDTRAQETQEYISVIKENSRIIGEVTSALHKADRR